ncbi:hypothetical protein D1815_20480 [Aquimarina sp. AD1]|uniref:hypothetical protein n=2 Tax=Aquimarina sp. (strain AD1) TaxID=1714848 RepID=UPI000E53A972|nr:hypothetical protein [Aquimarina sp. AD1]AXT58015.1 hypothetical protein D1815_20480 [Aquimarina sp. AD1]RKN05620.1 hypothetical protein D7035_21325 [Aquimarina sp. AD1]
MKTFYIYSVCLLVLLSCKQHIKTNEEIEVAFQGLDKAKLQKELGIIVKNDMRYRKPLDSLYRIGKQPPKKEWDSLWSIQERLDDQNTQKLITFTEKYGFPNPNRSGKPIPIWLIFQHADDKYCDQLMPLLHRELEAKRMTTAEYHLIKWNLEGRQELLPLKIVTKN